MAIGIDWRNVLKAKSKRQQDLSTWTDEDWGSAEQHRAKAKGKTPKATLDYQDRKKRKGRESGQQHVPTGKKFSQK